MAERVQRNVTVKINSDSTGLRKGLNAGRRQLRGFKNDLRGLRTDLVAFGGIAAGAFAGIGGAALFGSLAESADKVAKLGVRLKGTTLEMQQLRSAAQLAGTDLGLIEKASIRAARAIGDQLINPTKTLERALATLGIEGSDALRKLAVQANGPLGAFKALAPLIAQLPVALQNSVGGALFGGRNFNKLIPLIENYEATLQRVRAITSDIGLGLVDEQQVKNVQDMNDNFSTLVSLGRIFGEQVVANMAGPLKEISQAVLDTAGNFFRAEGGGNALAAVVGSKLVSGIVSFSEGAQRAWDIASRLGNVFANLANAGAFDKLVGMIEFVADKLVMLSGLIDSVVNSKVGKVAGALLGMPQAAIEGIGGAVQGLSADGLSSIGGSAKELERKIINAGLDLAGAVTGDDVSRFKVPAPSPSRGEASIDVPTSGFFSARDRGLRPRDDAAAAVLNQVDSRRQGSKAEGSAVDLKKVLDIIAGSNAEGNDLLREIERKLGSVAVAG